MTTLRIGAGLSTDIHASRAAAEAADEATERFGLEQPNLVMTFLSQEHADFAEDVAGFLGERFPAAAVIGCTGDGVIAGSRELEEGPALSIFAAFLPDTQVRPFGLQFVETGDGVAEYVGWPDQLSPDGSLLLLADPFSFPSAHLLAHLNDERPGTLVVGGIATGARSPGDTRLFYGGKVFTEGAVAVAISGRVRVQTLVSQGCRPVGSPSTVTRADRNVVFELGGRRALDVFADLWSKADAKTRALLQSGPQIGRVIDEYKPEYEPGDFLVRPLVGSEREIGALVVGDLMEVGQTVQFHVRDPAAADDDLRLLLQGLPTHPGGALLFSCVGRG
ncbi:MAG: FIST C-terminal domain-containing protein, partial [Actinobacteria bacterium]|nr:FIST C-terminal domain-containing protein [Actinomycetota bacterium]